MVQKQLEVHATIPDGEHAYTVFTDETVEVPGSLSEAIREEGEEAVYQAWLVTRLNRERNRIRTALIAQEAPASARRREGAKFVALHRGGSAPVRDGGEHSNGKSTPRPLTVRRRRINAAE